MPHSSGDSPSWRGSHSNRSLRESRSERGLTAFPHFLSTPTQIPCPRDVRPTIKIGLNASINVVKIIPRRYSQRHSQRLISEVILESVKLKTPTL